MRILHIITGLNTGGAERMLVKLIESTNQLSVNHSVISLLDKGSQGEILEKQGVTVRCLNMKQGIPSLSKLMKLRNLIVDENPDVIQSWMYHANIAAYLAIFYKDYPLIFNIRHALNDYKNEKRSTKIAIKINSIISPKVEGVIFNSVISKQQHEKYGYKSKSINVIPNGFNTESYKPNEKYRREIRNYYDIRDGEILVGNVGRNHPVKGFDIFLKGCSLVAKQADNVKFILIGRGIKEDQGLHELSYSLGIKDSVIFENERSDLEMVWPAFDIYCNTSHSEAFSNTIGEAMLNKIPCIVANVGDSAKIVGNAGIVIAPNSPKDIADAVLGLSSLDKMALSKIGIKARNRIVKNYSIEKVSRNYIDLYQTVSGNTRNDSISEF